MTTRTTVEASTFGARPDPGQTTPSEVVGLVVVASPDAEACGRHFPLKHRLNLGRSPARRVSVVLRDDRVSSLHAAVRRVARECVIHDLDSRNGTWVNGQRVAEARLAPGDVLRLGETLLTFEALPNEHDEPDDVLLGRSGSWLRVVRAVRRLAPSSLPVLLQGETGTGKEVVARRLHDLSGRSGPFVAVNCGAIPGELAEAHLFGHRRGAFTGAVTEAAGVFRAARGGTLFLDELGELSPTVQPKLLRALESREVTPVGAATPEAVDVRVVAATHVELAKAVAAGRFRQDLSARLTGLAIGLPPLRSRPSDVPLLLRHFLREAAGDDPWELGPRFLEVILAHSWPLNVRELCFFAQRLVLLAGDGRSLTRQHARWLDPEVTGTVPPTAAVAAPAAVPPPAPGGRRRPSRDEMHELLQRNEGNVTRLAEHYGKNPKQIYRWLKAHALEPSDYR